MSTVRPIRRPRSRFWRRVVLTRARLRRCVRRSTRRLILLGGWTWLAAGSLVGFEVLEMLFGTLALAPEFIPLLIVGLAAAWYFQGPSASLRTAAATPTPPAPDRAAGKTIQALHGAVRRWCSPRPGRTAPQTLGLTRESGRPQQEGC